MMKIGMTLHRCCLHSIRSAIMNYFHYIYKNCIEDAIRKCVYKAIFPQHHKLLNERIIIIIAEYLQYAIYQNIYLFCSTIVLHGLNFDNDQFIAD